MKSYTELILLTNSVFITCSAYQILKTKLHCHPSIYSLPSTSHDPPCPHSILYPKYY